MTDLLHTDRLTLRPMRPEDAEGLHDFFSDQAATRYFGNVHRRLEETEAFARQSSFADPTRTLEYTLLREDRAIGKAGIWSAPELGFFLRRADWGKGLMHEALCVLIPHFFARMPLSHMTADVDPRNVPSLKLLKSFGFRETGRAENTIQIDGEWADSIYLRLEAFG